MCNKKLLHELLIEVRDNEKEPNSGICKHVLRLIDKTAISAHKYRGVRRDMPLLMKELLVLWPKFSGCITFPVGEGMHDYLRAVIRGTVWEGEYGKLRLELLDFLIEQTKE